MTPSIGNCTERQEFLISNMPNSNFGLVNKEVGNTDHFMFHLYRNPRAVEVQWSLPFFIESVNYLEPINADLNVKKQLL